MELQTVFTAVCNMTITASVVLGCVLLARLALGKAPKGFVCALWLVVLFRLLCPVAPSAPVSVLSVVDAPRVESGVGAVTYFRSPVQAPLETMYADPSLMQEAAPSAPAMLRTPIDWHLHMTRVWAVGLCALSIYGVLSYVNLKRRLRESVPVFRGVREADGIRTPFVLGFLRPTIYLPSDLPEEERDYIVLHERFHVRHGDHLVRALFFLAVCVHWFNPLVWLAFGLCTRDMEMRCDEAVLKKLGGQIRCDYAQSLLKLATGRRMPLCAPLAFGEGDTGKRVKHVLKWKRGKLWLTIPAAALCIAVLTLTACDPAEEDTPFGHSYRVSAAFSTAELNRETPELFTLTSDSILTLRQDGKNVMYGALKEVTAGTPLPGTMPEGTMTTVTPLENTWKTEDDGWWLFQKEGGELYLWREGDYLLKLERADLLGVTVRQQGMESYVEPVWYPSAEWEWISTTPVDAGAQLVLTPELDADMILVSEEYYERMADGECVITTTDHFLEPDEKGEFLLDVARRGSVGDDFAVYTVTVGEECYIFHLSFPAVPGETAVSVHAVEQTRDIVYSENGVEIALQIPESWDYSITSLADDAYSAGIAFWPRGREEGKLRFQYYPGGFGVCGTGLETEGIVLAGQNVTAGTYDNEPLWTFLSFSGDFAVWGENHESWWAEYGETAMEILDSAQYAPKVLE